jgi:hypothetical protein
LSQVTFRHTSDSSKPDRSARFALPCRTALIIPFSSLLCRSVTGV